MSELAKSSKVDTLVDWIATDDIHNGKLICLFKSLTVNSYGYYSTKHTKISLQRFEQFVVDFFFYTSTFSKKDFLSFINHKFDRQSSDSSVLGTPHNRIFLSYKTFLRLLVEISFLRRRKKRSMKSLKKLLRIIYESEKYEQYKNLLPLSLWNEVKDMKILFFKYDNPLRRIFSHFSSKTNDSSSKGTKSGMYKTRLMKQDFEKKRSEGMIKYTEIVRFCQYLGVTQGGSISSSRGFGVWSISQFEIRRIYRTLFNKSFREQNQIDFCTFRTFVTRLALFYYQRPSSPECQKTIDVLLLVFFQKFLHPCFKKLFHKDIEDYLVDLDSIPPPDLLELKPDYASFETNSQIRIRGRGFDFRKGGVYLRIQTPTKEISVPCYRGDDHSNLSSDEEEDDDREDDDDEKKYESPKPTVRKKDEFNIFSPHTNSIFGQYNASNFDELVERTQNMEKYLRKRESEIVCNVPLIDPNEEVDGTKMIILIRKSGKTPNPNVVDPHYPRKVYRYCFEVRVFNYLRVSASVTNDMESFCDESLEFYYVDRMDPFLIGSEVTVLILEYFKTFKFLDVEKWEGMKKFFRKRLEKECIFKKPTRKELDQQYSILHSVSDDDDDDEGEEEGRRRRRSNLMNNTSSGASEYSKRGLMNDDIDDDDDYDDQIDRENVMMDQKNVRSKRRSKKRYVFGSKETSLCTFSHSLSSIHHKVNGIISLERFLRLLVVFSLTEVQGLHPLDFLIKLIHLHQIVKSEEEYVRKSRISKPPSMIDRISGKIETEVEERRRIRMSLYVRYRREFDVYYGPILIGMVFEKEGNYSRVGRNVEEGKEGKEGKYQPQRRRNNNNNRKKYVHNLEDIIQLDQRRLNLLKKKMTVENSWFGYTQYCPLHERMINRIIEFSENFDHLIDRFLGYGFDLAPAYRNTTSRQPIGRNWQIYYDRVKLGMATSSSNTTTTTKKDNRTMMMMNMKNKSSNNNNNNNEKKNKERVGVLLDYEGHFGTLQWVPSVTDLLNKNYTLCCYSSIEEKCRYFLDVFRKSKDLKGLRKSMENMGYKFCLVL